jgi:hypothetical protein
MTTDEVELETVKLRRFFKWEHLPPHLQDRSKPFAHVADLVISTTPANRERLKALDLLLAAKDAAVRAALPE